MQMLGVDVGGTFADPVYCDMETGALTIHKVSTTPDDPSRHAARRRRTLRGEQD